MSAYQRHRQPDDLLERVRKGPAALKAACAATLQHGEVLDPAGITGLPPIPQPGKIICVGLNHLDHRKESKFEQPAYPTVFRSDPNSSPPTRCPKARSGCGLRRA